MIKDKKLAKITVLTNGTYGPGTFSFPARSIPTITQAEFIVDITNATDPLPDIMGAIELSFDGGNTWQDVGMFSRAAGPKGFDRLGNPATTLGYTVDLAQPQNSNRRARGRVTVGAAIQASLVINTTS